MVLTTYNPTAAPESLAISTKTKSGKKENGIKYNGGETARRNERESEEQERSGASVRPSGVAAAHRSSPLSPHHCSDPPPPAPTGKDGACRDSRGGPGGGGPCFTRLMCKIRRPGPVDARSALLWTSLGSCFLSVTVSLGHYAWV